MREILATHRRIDPVRTDENRAARLGPVGEVRDHAVLVLFVPDELFAEADVAEALEQNLPQREPVDVALGLAVVQDELGARDELAVVDRGGVARLSGGGQEQLVQVRRQDLPQRLVTAGIDVQPITLPARVQRGIAFVDLARDPGFAQPLREAQPAEPGPDHEHGVVHVIRHQRSPFRTNVLVREGRTGLGPRQPGARKQSEWFVRPNPYRTMVFRASCSLSR